MRGRAVAAACLATTLAACGGGERQASPLERWRQQADAACDRAEKAIREGGRPTSPDDLERVVVRVGDIAIETAGEIRGLKAPEG